MEGHASAAEGSPSQKNSMFEAVRAYDFSNDSEFKAGLASILGHSTEGPSTEELSQQQDLTLQAQCFYYSRKMNLQPTIDWQSYKTWLQFQARARERDPTLISVETNQSHDVFPSTSLSAAPVQPATAANGAPYPTSFSHIIDLITRNEPVPGIEQIPDTVLDAEMSRPSTTPKRRKPWEISQAESSPSDVPSAESS